MVVRRWSAASGFFVAACGPQTHDPEEIELAYVRTDEAETSAWVVGVIPGEYSVDLLPQESGIFVRSFDWSSDGRYLVATRNVREAFDVVVLTVASGETTVMPGLLGVDCSPSELVCRSRRAQERDGSEPVLIELESGSVRPFEFGPSSQGTWSPQGDRMASVVSTGTEGSYELQIVDLASGAATDAPLQLAGGLQLDGAKLAWSPAGDVIALTALDPMGYGAAMIATIDVTSHEVVTWSMAPFSWAEVPEWSPDASRVALPGAGFDAVTVRDYGVSIFDASSGSLVETVDTATELVWDADGRMAAALLQEDGTLSRTRIVVGEGERPWSSSSPGSEQDDRQPRWRPR